MERWIGIAWWMFAVIFAPMSARAQTDWVDITPAHADEDGRFTDCAVIGGELFVSREREILRANDPRGVPSWRTVYEHEGGDDLIQFVVHPTAGTIVLGELSSIVRLDYRTWTLEHRVEGRPGLDFAFVDAEGRMHVVPSIGAPLRRGDGGTWAPESRGAMRASVATWGAAPCGWTGSSDGALRAACFDEETGDVQHYTVVDGRWAQHDAPPVHNELVIFDWASPTLVATYRDDRPGGHVWLRRAGGWDELPLTPTPVGNACQDGDTIYAMSGRRIYRAELPTE